MTFAQLEAKLTRNTKKITFDIANSFAADIKIAPVVSGDLRRGWRVEDIVGGYKVVNSLPYAPKIWVGKPSAPDTWQVPNGLHPIYTKYKKLYVSKIKKVDL